MIPPEMTQAVDALIRFNPNTQRKLHILGYDNPELVERKLKEIERTKTND